MTGRAERDLVGVLDWFIEQQAPEAGERWHERLRARVATLKTQPRSCPRVEEAAKQGVEVRELRYGKRRGAYRILFVIRDRTVHIVHIRHTARAKVTRSELKRLLTVELTGANGSRH
jgi:plasmid stabilization system protein ParE